MVEYWRKRGWFNADLIDHNGVYLYSVERVEQLKAVYRRDWQTAWRSGAALGLLNSIASLTKSLTLRTGVHKE